MQSENFDKKIKDSLSQRPPGNDTPQWDKMEPLLDKHMPVEKDDRRRIFFILFLFLLLGGGAFFIFRNNGGDDHEITASKPNTENPIQNNKSNSSDNTKVEKQSAELPNNNSPEISSTQKTDKPSIQSQSNTNNNINKTVLSTPEKRIDNSVVKDRIVQKINRSNRRTTKPIKQTNNNNEAITSVDNNVKQDAVTPVEEKQKIDESQKPTEIQKQEEQIKKEDENKKDDQQPIENKTDEEKQKLPESQPILTANSKIQKQKGKSSLFSNLFFSASVGPDLSTVKFDYAGKTKIAYGAGIGYKISKKVSIQTGFYVSRKIYSADPEDYYIPDQFVYYYPHLKPIEADCKVYEVPLNITYHFNPDKKQTWFASLGSSSLFMKKETYDYYYKSRFTYQDTTSTRVLQNQNRHYFSTLNISSGYERKINEHFTLQVEPYMKIAMKGIGSGKVKLNSGGVFFTAILKPFARKNTIKNSP